MRAIVITTTTLLTTLCTPAWAINKCTGPDGKVSFQDTPCTGGRAEAIQLRPMSAPPAPVKPVVPAPQAAPPTPQGQPPATAPAAEAAPRPERTKLEVEAEQCMEWYRPKLRDPAGAYYREPAKDGRVLSILVYGTNGYGGYVSKAAACEFVNGRLDGDWTKIHAKHRGWAED